MQQKEKKERERSRRKKYIKKANLLLGKVNPSGQLTREIDATQFGRGLTRTWVPLPRQSIKENAEHRWSAETASITIPFGGD